MTAPFVTSTVSTAVDRVVLELLDLVPGMRPPIHPLAIAEALQVRVAVDASQSGRGRAKRLEGQAAIFLKPDERPERVFWAAAHELGELLAWRVDAVANALGAETIPHRREDTANLFASRLLLPAEWFEDDAIRLDGDLVALKSLYSTASHELIAMRLLDLAPPTIVTVFDHGRMVRRRSTLEGRLPPLQAVEKRAQQEAHHEAVSVDVTEGPLRTQAWPIHEPGWKREILRTTVGEE